MIYNVSERLYWVQWSKMSPVRGSDDVMSPKLGKGPVARQLMDPTPSR